MAEFNPPDSHWAGDFDARLLGTFHYLKERVEALEAEVRALRAKDGLRDRTLERAVKDMKHHVEARRTQGGKP